MTNQNPKIAIINKLKNNTYSMDNVQPVMEAIDLIERLSVDEDGELYFDWSKEV